MNNHIKSKIKINTSNFCATCPNKIYTEDEDVVTFGIGNINANLIFVLPDYDFINKNTKETLFTKLSELYKQLKGFNIEDDVYTTRFVKCFSRSNVDLYEQSIPPCSKYLIYEITRLVAKNIIFFGSTYDYYLNNIGTVNFSFPNKRIFNIYSPGVLFHDDSKIKQKFIDDLSKILNTISYDNY